MMGEEATTALVLLFPSLPEPLLAQWPLFALLPRCGSTWDGKQTQVFPASLWIHVVM